MRAERIAAPAAISASLLLHWLWGAFMPAGSVTASLPPSSVEFSIESSPVRQREPEPASRAEPEPAPPPSSQPATPPAPKRAAQAARSPQPASEPQVARAAREERSQWELAPETPPAPPAQAAPESPPTAANPSPAQGTPRMPDLSPQAVARSWQPAESDPYSCKARGGANSQACSDELGTVGKSVRQRELDAQRELNRSLRAATQQRPELAPRPAPKLAQHSDGSYSYAGSALKARIAPDGHVSFDESLASLGAVTSFDIQGVVEKHVFKQEQLVAEKNWFLDQTKELRRQLADAARAQEGADAKRTLERELERILRGPLAPSQKRRAVFDLWVGCRDDGDTPAMHQLVEAFVRRHMPQGSALGFTAEELEQLNRGRSGARRFDPYAGGAPG